jgi:hypothetical protein
LEKELEMQKALKNYISMEKPIDNTAFLEEKEMERNPPAIPDKSLIYYQFREKTYTQGVAIPANLNQALVIVSQIILDKSNFQFSYAGNYALAQYIKKANFLNIMDKENLSLFQKLHIELTEKMPVLSLNDYGLTPIQYEYLHTLRSDEI